MSEPIWLTRQIVEIVHADLLAEHGGRSGLRDEDALESAIARPRQRYAYAPATAIHRLAASLCFGIAQDHPFIDGNKRTALLATYVFLALNGRTLEADESEAASIIETLASGALDEDGLAAWIGTHAV